MVAAPTGWGSLIWRKGENSKGRKIDRLVVHCTGTPQSATVESIKRYWKSELDWDNPGYHGIILTDGHIHELASIDEMVNGAKGYNRHSIHIAWLGGAGDDGKPLDNRTDAQKNMLHSFIAGFRSHFPNADVVGHRDLSPDLDGDGIIEPWEWVKACPCFDVKEFMKAGGIK